MNFIHENMFLMYIQRKLAGSYNTAVEHWKSLNPECHSIKRMYSE